MTKKRLEECCGVSREAGVDELDGTCMGDECGCRLSIAGRWMAVELSELSGQDECDAQEEQQFTRGKSQRES